MVSIPQIYGPSFQIYVMYQYMQVDYILKFMAYRVHLGNPMPQRPQTSERQGESAASCSEAKPTWKRWRNMGETWGSQLTGNMPPPLFDPNVQ